METLKAIIRYIKMPKLFKEAARQAIECFYKEAINGNLIKAFSKENK